MNKQQRIALRAAQRAAGKQSRKAWIENGERDASAGMPFRMIRANLWHTDMTLVLVNLYYLQGYRNYEKQTGKLCESYSEPINIY